MTDLKDQERNDEARVADGRAGAAATLLRDDVGRTQENDRQDHCVDDSDQRDTHHYPHRDEHDLYTSTIITVTTVKTKDERLHRAGNFGIFHWENLM